MTLRPEYSLGHSQYNAFLFAPVGEERTGQQLTALTLLTRLGIDPWQEASRLADMPKEKAAHAFAEAIVRLPEQDRSGWDAQAIAQRVVSCLPAASVPPVPSLAGASPIERGSAPRSSSSPSPASRSPAPRRPMSRSRWLLWGALALALALFVYNLPGAHQLEPPAWHPAAEGEHT